MLCLDFFQQADLNGNTLKSLTWKYKYSSNSSKGCVLEADLEHPKELRELHNDYSYF